MSEFYNIVNQMNPDNRNMALTVAEGEAVGEKALLSDHRIIWGAENGRFFHCHKAEAEKLEESGLYLIGGQKVFCELLGREKKLVICGGGHVSAALIRMGVMTGYEVTVLEDRSAFADQAKEAGAVRAVCAPFDSGLAKIPGDRDTFFVIATRGHRYDQICLEAVVRKPHAYIGMVGSRKRVAIVKENLVEKGADPEVVSGIYTPVGLDIGAETPEEIAVAILAEIIQVRRKKKESCGYSRALLRAILTGQPEDPKVLATIVSRKGSAPREAGTKMLILPDGNCVDTIGGGSVEADVLREGLRMLRNGEKTGRLFHVDISGRTAEEEGMVCGGVIDVMLEIIGRRQ